MEKFLARGLHRYFMAIIPPSPFFEQTQELKNYFSEKYQSRAALNAPPHITLHMPFLWKAKKENLLISSLKKFAAQQKKFEIQFEKFDSFPPRVIFIKVNATDPLQKLQLDLHRFCKTQLYLFNALYKDFPFRPHLTVAFRDLKKPMYENAWREFKEKKISAAFVTDTITLLKHNGKIWESFHHFQF